MNQDTSGDNDVNNLNLCLNERFVFYDNIDNDIYVSKLETTSGCSPGPKDRQPMAGSVRGWETSVGWKP